MPPSSDGAIQEIRADYEGISNNELGAANPIGSVYIIASPPSGLVTLPIA